jgi:hypothetical protein
MHLGLEIACFVWLCQQAQSKPPQTWETLVGSSACRAELSGSGAEFGLALDRKQHTYAESRIIGGKPTLLVIQYADENDHCGTLNDIVIAPNPKDIFEFECIDNTNRKRAVIGVHPDGPFARLWKASKAWIIDFEKLKLIPTGDSVTCLNYNYAGSDNGSDIRSRVAARANKKSP